MKKSSVHSPSPSPNVISLAEHREKEEKVSRQKSKNPPKTTATPTPSIPSNAKPTRSAASSNSNTAEVEAVLANLSAPVATDSWSADQLARITETGREVRSRIEAIAATEEVLEANQKELRRLTNEVLPGLMDEAGIKTLSLDDGTALSREEEVFASVSKENAREACEWLSDNGFGSLVKAAFLIPVEKGDLRTQSKVRSALRKMKIYFEENALIHPVSLKAFARESVNEGRKLPPVFKVHVQPTVKVKPPKKSRSN